MEQEQQLLAFYNRDVTEYEYTIWDDLIMCSKWIEIQIWRLLETGGVHQY